MDYEQFMQECMAACRERHACQPGYHMLLESKTVPEILMTVARNWDDVWKSRYSDIVAQNITRWFDGLEDEFHASGFFVNEETNKGIVFVSHPDRILSFTGRAKVYIFAKAHVIAKDNVQVYCRDKNSEIELYDTSYGKIEAGRVIVHDMAEVESWQECVCFDKTKVYALGGILHNKGHRLLSCANNVQVIKEK